MLILSQMKNFLLSWFVLFPYASQAQSTHSPADSSTTATPTLFPAATVPTPGVARAELYLRAKLWLLNNHSLGRYKWLADKNTNLVALKGEYYLPTAGLGGAWLSYSLKLLVRDGNYHYALTELYVRKSTFFSGKISSAEPLLAGPSTRKADRRYQALATQHLTLLLSNLRSEMQRPTPL